MALLPLLCALAACALEGRSLLEVYLPASEWNDELFYYKQVEGILAHGYPYGYFGFNESHALQLSFAARCWCCPGCCLGSSSAGVCKALFSAISF